jgi:hypothetical protein
MSAEGGKWEGLLNHRQHGYQSDSEALMGVIDAMVVRHFTDTEIWQTLEDSAIYSARIDRKGETHARELVKTEVAKARADVIPFADDPGEPVTRHSTRAHAPETVTDLEPRKLAFRTAQQMASMPAAITAWIVVGLLALGCITELDAKVKTGKTTLLGHLAAAILSGALFLGFETTTTSIVLLTEERPATTRVMLLRCGLLDANRLHIVTLYDAKGLAWPEVCAQVGDYAQSVGAEVIIIDTISRWPKIPGDEENSAGASSAAFEPVEDLAAQGFAVLVTRHDRKSGGDVGDSGRGSSATSGASDIILHLTRATSEGHATRRRLDGVGRFDEVPPTLLIELRDGAYAVVGDAVEVERHEAKAKILEILSNATSPVTEDEIIGPTGIARSTFQRARDELLKERHIERAKGYGKNGRAWGHWLAGQSSAQLREDPGQSIDEPKDTTTCPIST